ncbi:hypothetical protein ACFL4X_00430 [Gemmatimonadota bacterium]
MPTGPSIDYKMSIVSGNYQTGPLDTQLANPLRIYVTNDANVKQVAVVVTFKIVEGGGDLSASSVVTDVDGFCEVYLTPTYVGGTIKVEAKVRYTDTIVTFTATGV